MLKGRYAARGLALIAAGMSGVAMATDPVLQIPADLGPVGIANSMMTIAAPVVVSLLGLSFILGLAVMVKRMVSRKSKGVVA